MKEACSSQRVPVLTTTLEFYFSQEQLSLSLCCRRPRHAVCVTAQIPSTSSKFVSGTGDTVAVLISSDAMSFHDSHSGVTVLVRGRGTRAAEVFEAQLFAVLE